MFLFSIFILFISHSVNIWDWITTDYRTDVNKQNPNPEYYEWMGLLLLKGIVYVTLWLKYQQNQTEHACKQYKTACSYLTHYCVLTCLLYEVTIRYLYTLKSQVTTRKVHCLILIVLVNSHLKSKHFCMHTMYTLPSY